MEMDTKWQVTRCYSNPHEYRHSIKFGEPTKLRIASMALRALEDAWKADQARHEANVPILEKFKEAREKIEAVMAEVGMPKSARQEIKSRSRWPKYQTVDAGWVQDMRRHFPIGDGWGSVEATYKSLKALYDEYAAKAQKEAEEEVAAADRARKAEIERQRVELLKATIIVRYGLTPDQLWSWDDILEELRKRDQRLDLAVAMRRTRGDWSEGFWRVAAAMERFKIRDDLDKDIIASVGACFGGFDGRVFRDCAWNYDRLFDEAEDKQLAADIQVAMQNGNYEGP